MAFVDVLSQQAPVVANLQAVRWNGYLVVSEGHQFQRRNGVQIGRHDRTGHDPDTFTRADGSAPGGSCECGSHRGQLQGLARQHCRTSERKAIHGGVVVRRNVQR